MKCLIDDLRQLHSDLADPDSSSTRSKGFGAIICEAIDRLDAYEADLRDATRIANAFRAILIAYGTTPEVCDAVEREMRRME